MNGDKRVILHIVFDGILFDRVYPSFEGMDNYENRYLLHVFGRSQDLKYIKNTEKLIRVDTREEWGRVVSDPQVDVIYMHGLWYSYLKLVDYIREGVVVMWWCYGMEIYENVLHWPPLLPVKLFKPRTRWFCLIDFGGLHFTSAELSYSFPKIYILLIRFYSLLKGESIQRIKQLLSRIDFAFTPLASELVELKKIHPYIKAKPFVLRRPTVRIPLEKHSVPNGILLEHSANITNNHLDIIAAIKKRKLEIHGRDIYIPLGYGEKRLAQKVKQEAVFDGAFVHCLMETLPYDKYQEMMSSCSHAIFGMMRQSGLGSIYLCFQKGIKTFFYKDSVLYKFFTSMGYIVYTIENDLNDIGIRTPLTVEQAKNNYDLYYSYVDENKTYQQQLDIILNDI